MSTIIHLTGLNQLNGILAKCPPQKLSVIDFHASWCGPCHAIAPTFDALSKQYKNVNFLKCDVDAAKDVAGQYKVSAMPTFIFLKGSTKVDEIRGADKAGLAEAVAKHSAGSPAGPSNVAFQGKGQTLGGLAASSKPALSTTLPDVSNIDPQFKILAALLGAYLVLWWLS